MSKERFERSRCLIGEAELRGRLTEVRGLSGSSGDKLVGLLQSVAAHQEEIAGGCFVEIGVFQGLTLMPVGRPTLMRVL